MPENSFPRFAYFDTNILSYIAKNKPLWTKLLDFLTKNSLTLGISGAQLVELFDAERLHQNLAEMLVVVPSALIKTADDILNEEVMAHPQQRTESLFYFPLKHTSFRRKWYRKVTESLII